MNAKAFITHGGLLSIQEAITFAVPMIVFPIFAEQDYNAARVERTGRGISLEISTLTLPQLEGAIQEVLTNKM
jgi:glucuronosyltransferase